MRTPKEFATGQPVEGIWLSQFRYLLANVSRLNENISEIVDYCNEIYTI